MTLLRDESGSYTASDDPGEPTTKAPRLSVTDEEGAILAVLAMNRSVLEIGTGLGVSTTYLARHAVSVTTFDPDAWVQKEIYPKVEKNERVRGTDRLPQHGWWDMVFIDGDHAVEQVRRDLLYAFGRLGNGGLIVAHDANAKNVKAAVDEWANPIYLTTTHGLAIIVKE